MQIPTTTDDYWNFDFFPPNSINIIRVHIIQASIGIRPQNSHYYIHNLQLIAGDWPDNSEPVFTYFPGNSQESQISWGFSGNLRVWIARRKFPRFHTGELNNLFETLDEKNHGAKNESRSFGAPTRIFAIRV